MPVTIDEIAKRCDLSRSAVAQVLSDPHHKRFPHKTRERILQAAEALHYVPNQLSRQLRSGKANVLSLILSYVDPELLLKTESAAVRLGYEVLFQHAQSQLQTGERHELTKAVERRVDGVIWYPAYDEATDLYEQGAGHVRENGIPTVLLGTGMRGFPSADVVAFDMEGACEQVVKHLINQGYRKLLYFCYPTHTGMPKVHVKRFLSMATEMGVAAKWVRPLSVVKDNIQLLADYLTTTDESVGVYCDTDALALCVLNCAKSKGMAVPEEIGVVTTGDTEYFMSFRMGEITDPPLSAVVREYGAMAEKAVELLVARVEKRKKGRGEKIVLPMDFIVRQSSQRNK